MVDRTKEFPRYMTINHAGKVLVFGESHEWKGFFVLERLCDRGSPVDKCSEKYLYEIEAEPVCECCGQFIKLK